MTGTTTLRQLLTLVLLMALLVITFILAHVDLGLLNTSVGLAIAAIKALLVGLFFMNLWWSDGLHRVFAIAGAFMLAILFSLALADFLSRSWLAMPGSFP